MRRPASDRLDRRESIGCPECQHGADTTAIERGECGRQPAPARQACIVDEGARQQP